MNTSSVVKSTTFSKNCRSFCTSG